MRADKKYDLKQNTKVTILGGTTFGGMTQTNHWLILDKHTVR